MGGHGEMDGVGTTLCILKTEAKMETGGVVEGKAVVCGGSLGLHDGDGGGGEGGRDGSGTGKGCVTK